MNEAIQRFVRIKDLLNQYFEPDYLEIVDESQMHAVPPEGGSHFKITVVSPLFRGQSLLQRHQSVYHILQSEFEAGLHALALHTYDPEEWAQRQEESPESPPCLGGGRSSLH